MAQPIHQTITTHGIVGELVIPYGLGPFPAVLCIGGSSGGISTEMAEPLAREGFVALALGYFGVLGTPDAFAELPLEYFQKAASWLVDQPMVKGSKIGVTGTSRGSEAALQLAAVSSRVGAVVAYVPSGIRWGGVDDRAPWTYGGEPLPYAHWISGTPYRDQGAVAKVDIFNRVLDEPAAYADAVIEVEKATCPILLLSGKDDRLWPSERMAALIMERLQKHNYPYPYEHIAYPNAGHRIKVPGLDASKYMPVSEDTVTHEILSLGGTYEGNKAASERAWSETVRILRSALL